MWPSRQGLCLYSHHCSTHSTRHHPAGRLENLTQQRPSTACVVSKSPIHIKECAGLNLKQVVTRHHSLVKRRCRKVADHDSPAHNSPCRSLASPTLFHSLACDKTPRCLPIRWGSLVSRCCSQMHGSPNYIWDRQLQGTARSCPCLGQLHSDPTYPDC